MLAELATSFTLSLTFFGPLSLPPLVSHIIGVVCVGKVVPFFTLPIAHDHDCHGMDIGISNSVFEKQMINIHVLHHSMPQVRSPKIYSGNVKIVVWLNATICHCCQVQGFLHGSHEEGLLPIIRWPIVKSQRQKFESHSLFFGNRAESMTYGLATCHRRSIPQKSASVRRYA